MRWNSHIPSPNPEWLDPKKNELGDASKYFHFNVAEAKKITDGVQYERLSKMWSIMSCR